MLRTIVMEQLYWMPTTQRRALNKSRTQDEYETKVPKKNDEVRLAVLVRGDRGSSLDFGFSSVQFRG